MLAILFIVLIFTLILAVIFKNQIKSRSCGFGFHKWQKSKYFCTHCRKGRGTLKVINGYKKDA